MGDRTWTSIQFSGAINRSVAEGLLAAMDDDNCTQCTGSDDDLSLDQLLIPHTTFYHDDCNYAQLDAIEGYCVEHGITFRKYWEPGGGYGSGMDLYVALLDRRFSACCVEGEPMIGLSLLKEMGAGAIQYLEGLTDFHERYPPLTIVD